MGSALPAPTWVRLNFAEKSIFPEHSTAQRFSRNASENIDLSCFQPLTVLFRAVATVGRQFRRFLAGLRFDGLDRGHQQLLVVRLLGRQSAETSPPVPPARWASG